jgi:N-acetylmuramoyl-L-alanine amidase
VRASVLAATVLLVGGGLLAGPAPQASAADLAGKTVVIDAGHGASADGPLSRQVPNGRGGTKDCQTSGTSTNDGFPEHTFTWDVASLIQAQLAGLGATTVMTRHDDTGPAACVDQRAATANAAHPDAIVSIHGDGGPASGHGFHVNYSAPPLNDAQSGATMRLAAVMRDQLVASGLAPSTYIGSDGLYGRADLAGLNLADYPAVLIELGNMRNADDAATMTSSEGQAAYAAAVVKGLQAYLAG